MWKKLDCDPVWGSSSVTLLFADETQFLNWMHTFVILAVGRQRREHWHEFRANCGEILSSRLA